MASPASQSRQYYIGIGGEQQGPFSEADVARKIQSGEIPQDAMYWHEGMSDWKPVASTTFSAAEPAPAAAAESEGPPEEAPRTRRRVEQVLERDPDNAMEATFAPADSVPEPIFKSGTGTFDE